MRAMCNHILQTHLHLSYCEVAFWKICMIYLPVLFSSWFAQTPPTEMSFDDTSSENIMTVRRHIPLAFVSLSDMMCLLRDLLARCEHKKLACICRNSQAVHKHMWDQEVKCKITNQWETCNNDKIQRDWMSEWRFIVTSAICQPYREYNWFYVHDKYT